MVAPADVSVMVALLGVVKVPVAGVITGVAAVGKLIVMIEVLTALVLKAGPPAMALIVVVEPTGIAVL
jgi:hypothetical protein